MARITLSTTPATVMDASPARRALELANTTDSTVYVRHGGMVDLASDANCGIPMAPGEKRSVSDALAQLAVTAVLPAGATSQVFHFASY